MTVWRQKSCDTRITFTFWITFYKTLFFNIYAVILWVLFSLKPCEAFRIAQCKQLWLVQPCLNYDLYFIFKTSGIALLEAIVSNKPPPNLFQENRKTPPPTLLKEPGSTCNFLQPLIQVCADMLYLKTKAPIFCCPIFFLKNISTLYRVIAKFQGNYEVPNEIFNESLFVAIPLKAF